jgi:hypothetical protein
MLFTRRTPLSLRSALPLALALGLMLPPASLAAEVLPFDALAGDSEQTARRKKKDDSKSKKDDDKENGDKTDEKKEKPFEEVIKDYKPVEGLFTIWQKEDESKIYLEILPDQMNKVFLLNLTLESGVGEGALLAAAMIGEIPVYLKKVGKNVQLVEKNVRFRADEKKPIARAVEQGFTDSILAHAKIESAPHPDKKSVLVLLNPYFLNDMVGIANYLKIAYGTGYSFDKDRSAFGPLKSFPENVEIETHSVYKSSNPKISYTIPDPRSLMVRMRYSLSSLKDTGYTPRIADDRVGHFLTVFQDYSSDEPDIPDVRYVNRWHLEKKDPLSRVSEPKEPIVFWIEKTVPEEYREAVRDGILLWNDAFEKIGFEDAIEVKIQPGDADWDAADSRYSTIRWIVAPFATFAQGPSRANPFTGQIYDADIRFGSDMMRFTLREFAEEIKPVQLEPAKTWTWRNTGYADPGQICNYVDGAVQQAAFGMNLLEARGVLDKNSFEAKKYLRDFLVHVTAHEVGHTLGLRHNFKASRIHKVSELHDSSLTEAKGITGSQMDYTPVNLAPDGTPQGQYWQTSLGPYDYWAIEYAYAPIDAERPEDELPELEKIASRASEPMLAYGTDEDTYGFSTRSIDPTTNLWDIGDDPVAFYEGRLDNARELWSKMEATFEKPGMSYQKMRQVFGRGLREFILAGMNVSKFIGGIYHHRDHVGDPNGRLPFVPVPAAKQREALEFLKANVFGPDAMKFPPELLNKLAPERLPDIFGSHYQIARLDYPIHSSILNIQTAPLSRIYDTVTLQRIADLEAHYASGADPLTMAEIFEGLREAIWAELKVGKNVSSFRRNLQRRHLDYMVLLFIRPGFGLPEDARTLARADLRDIRDGADRSLKTGRLDRITKAHLEETRDRINAVLDAQVRRDVFPSVRIGG